MKHCFLNIIFFAVFKRLFIRGIFLLLPFLLCNCVKSIETHHGYSFENIDIEQLKANITTKQEVIESLGNPSTKSDFGEEKWYYINYKNKSYAFLSPNQDANQVMVITFNNDDTIQQIVVENDKKFNTAEIVKEKTGTRGARRNYLIQMLNHLGYKQGIN